MNILVINSGSSSIKYQLFDMNSKLALITGQMERIGEPESHLLHCWLDDRGELKQLKQQHPVADHHAAFQAILEKLTEPASVYDIGQLSAIGHRVVHGGERFQSPVQIDDTVVEAIRNTCSLAPLHNPANLAGIEICLQLYPQIPQVAVFDTAFHQTMPARAYRYALPESWYKEYGIRRYGFHGSSHAYILRQAADYLQRPPTDLNLISLHLGNGASAAAISKGQCVDTSMGFTPLEGLIMGSRCGDIDPAIPLYLSRKTGADIHQLESILNQQSGLRGICGENDMREIQHRADSGDNNAQLAMDMYCYRIRKYIGAYTAVLQQVDALVFSAGVGEHASTIRQQVCTGLDNLGICIDNKKNGSARGPVSEIQADQSAVKILVVRTNEELEIAQQTMTCIEISG